jgi:hypothetical protein
MELSFSYTLNDYQEAARAARAAMTKLQPRTREPLWVVLAGSFLAFALFIGTALSMPRTSTICANRGVVHANAFCSADDLQVGPIKQNALACWL